MRQLNANMSHFFNCRFLLRSVGFLVTLTSVSSIHAAIIQFGPEFTFSNREVEKGVFRRENIFATDEGHRVFESRVIEPHLRELRKHMMNHLIQGQPKGAKFLYSNCCFLSPNHWWFKLEADPGVIEVTTKPMTLEYFERFQSDMQDAIFVSAANQGLFPYDYLGGGHINVSLDSFDSLMHLRNFIVDFINHAELSLGAFNYDTNNAMPFWMLSENKVRAFRRVLAEFDQNEYPHASLLFKAFTKAYMTGELDPYGIKWGNETQKRFALSFQNGVEPAEGSRRLEIRAFRPQKSMNMFVRQIRLLHKRIRKLRKERGPIALRPTLTLYKHSPRGEALLKPPVDPQKALQEFYKYVTETGEPWKDHRDYLWPQWIQDGELDQFESSLFFIENEVHLQKEGDCTSSLEQGLFDQGEKMRW